MSDCNFIIPFTGSADKVLVKARFAVESQGGKFDGNLSSGDFTVSVMGNNIAGSYTVTGQDMNIIITSKPFMIPCSMIEGFLKNQVK